MAGDEDLATAVALIAPLLGAPGGLGKRIAALETDLAGQSGETAAGVVASHGLTAATFAASLLVREELGKLSDLIHATGIALALPHLLEAGEVLKTPSLAAGNDPGRQYDVETNVRAAEFKFARWTNGGNGGREKDLFKDLVLLTQAPMPLRAEIYVRGPRPARFLAGRASARKQLKRSQAVLAVFDAQVSDPEVTVAAYVAAYAERVRVIDLEEAVPSVFACGASARSSQPL
ncbi:MAG TPA: hypothetical protein VF533_24250 [Solirubrobacteraceae bacterium]|jgi:hypothetical protein